MKKYANGIISEMTQEEIEELKRQQKEWERQEKQRPFSESEIFALFAKQQINTLSVDDNTALRMKSYYPTWQELVDAQFTAEKAGYKFTYGDDLYKTVSPNQQFLENWVPGQGTESVFERIDETHAGTKTDPIPYKVNMTVYADKYYTEDGILYRCIRNSEQPLQQRASELRGIYFETADMEKQSSVSENEE